MERFSDNEDMAAALATLRPTPRPTFAAELDKRVAADFPRRSRLWQLPPAKLGKRFRMQSAARLAYVGGSAALVAIAVATALIASNGSDPTSISLDRSTGERQSGAQDSELSAAGKPGGVQYSESLPISPQARESASAANGQAFFSPRN